MHIMPKTVLVESRLWNIFLILASLTLLGEATAQADPPPPDCDSGWEWDNQMGAPYNIGGYTSYGGPIAACQGTIYTCINHSVIVAWNDIGAWWTVASFPGSINCMTVRGSTLYVGGSFDGFRDGNNAFVNGTNVASMNALSGVWSPIGTGTATEVFAIAVDTALNVYIGLTEFAPTTSCGYPGMLARFDTSSQSWVSVGCGLRVDTYSDSACSPQPQPQNPPPPSPVVARVSALYADGTDIYVAGGFDKCGSDDAYHVAKWNGSAWTPLATDPHWCWRTARSTPWISSILMYSNRVYVAGEITPACNPNTGSPYTYPFGLAEFAPNGTGLLSGAEDNLWTYDSNYDEYFAAPGRDLCKAGCTVYVTGEFDTIGSTDGNSGTPANGISRRVGTGAWGPLGSGLKFGTDPGGAQHLAADTHWVWVQCDYFYGDMHPMLNFDTAGGYSAAGLARWADPNYLP